MIENAFVLAAARRLMRPTDALPLGTIRSLAYVLPVIEEVLANRRANLVRAGGEQEEINHTQNLETARSRILRVCHEHQFVTRPRKSSSSPASFELGRGANIDDCAPRRSKLGPISPCLRVPTARFSGLQ